ncbi:DNA -binding domain-containing protein [Tsuneonella suprasediminis]|uniref:DNA -binding domain-containing protein n=1 Tax=Tsuneonella suprasediminis TaxID=2306996 RepID=UPI0039C9CDD1
MSAPCHRQGLPAVSRGRWAAAARRATHLSAEWRAVRLDRHGTLASGYLQGLCGFCRPCLLACRASPASPDRARPSFRCEQGGKRAVRPCSPALPGGGPSGAGPGRICADRRRFALYPYEDLQRNGPVRTGVAGVSRCRRPRFRGSHIVAAPSRGVPSPWSLPAQLFPPERRARRWARALQAWDGRMVGASHREIASVLYGHKVVRHDWYGPSDYQRTHVRRLLQTADGLIRDGWRKLLW